MNWIYNIYFSKYFIFFSAICALTGLYREFLIIFSLVLIHETGHILVAYLFKFNIEKIIVNPYGATSIINHNINIEIYKEVLLITSGLIMQCIYFILVTTLYKHNLMTVSTYKLFKLYHYNILLFNIVPILPLDGGKLTNLIFSLFLPFKKAHLFTILFSILVLPLIFLTSLSLSNKIIIVIILLIKIYSEFNKHSYIFNKFLLERYINNYKFKETKIITSKNDMMRDKNHIIINDNDILSEESMLITRFEGKF